MAVRFMDMLRLAFRYVFASKKTTRTKTTTTITKRRRFTVFLGLSGSNCCRFLMRSLVVIIVHLTCSLEHKSTADQHICSFTCVCVCVGEIVAQDMQLVLFLHKPIDGSDFFGLLFVRLDCQSFELHWNYLHVSCGGILVITGGNNN